MATILAVDDAASMRKMVGFTIKEAGYEVEEAGYEVEEASDGAEALAKAKARHYDLVLTDVNMPNMDGIKLTRELRSLPGYKFTPILLLTTEAGQEKKQQGKAAGATGWMVKPFQPEKLIAIINRVLA